MNGYLAPLVELGLPLGPLAGNVTLREVPANPTMHTSIECERLAGVSTHPVNQELASLTHTQLCQACESLLVETLSNEQQTYLAILRRIVYHQQCMDELIARGPATGLAGALRDHHDWLNLCNATYIFSHQLGQTMQDDQGALTATMTRVTLWLDNHLQLMHSYRFEAGARLQEMGKDEPHSVVAGSRHRLMREDGEVTMNADDEVLVAYGWDLAARRGLVLVPTRVATKLCAQTPGLGSATRCEVLDDVSSACYMQADEQVRATARGLWADRLQEMSANECVLAAAGVHFQAAETR